MEVRGLHIFTSNRSPVIARYYKAYAKAELPLAWLAEDDDRIGIYQLGSGPAIRELAKSVSKRCKCKVLTSNFGIAPWQERYFGLCGATEGKVHASKSVGYKGYGQTAVENFCDYLGPDYQSSVWDQEKVLLIVTQLERVSGLFFGRLSERGITTYLDRHGYSIVHQQPRLIHLSKVSTNTD